MLKRKISIDGLMSEVDATYDEFWIKFSDWVVSNGWEFSGDIVELEKEGRIKTIDFLGELIDEKNIENRNLVQEELKERLKVEQDENYTFCYKWVLEHIDSTIVVKVNDIKEQKLQYPHFDLDNGQCLFFLKENNGSVCDLYDKEEIIKVVEGELDSLKPIYIYL